MGPSSLQRGSKLLYNNGSKEELMMQDNVIDLDTYRPHISGEAKCLSCGHEWVAVAPTGSVEFECPECKTWKGVYCGMTAPETVWQCDCGNQHFYIDNISAMCSRCGLRVEI